MFFAVVSDHYLHSELRKIQYIWANYLHYSYSVIARAITVIIQISALGEKGLIHVNWSVCNFKQHQSDTNIKDKKGRRLFVFSTGGEVLRSGEDRGADATSGRGAAEVDGGGWGWEHRAILVLLQASTDGGENQWWSGTKREKLIRAGQTGDWFSPQQGGYQEPTHQCHGLIGWQRWWKGWKIWDVLRWMWQ